MPTPEGPENQYSQARVTSQASAASAHSRKLSSGSALLAMARSHNGTTRQQINRALEPN